MTFPETTILPEIIAVPRATVAQDGNSIFDICHRVFKTRGLTEDRNSCLKKIHNFKILIL